MQVFGAWKVNSLAVLFPLILSLVAFVLAMIALFAGTGPQQQQLEEYHIIAVCCPGTSHSGCIVKLTIIFVD